MLDKRIKINTLNLLTRLLDFVSDDESDISTIIDEVDRVLGDKADDFLKMLPEIKRLLKTDLQALFDGDPAADSLDVIKIAYPGYLAIATYRIAHGINSLGLTLVARIMSESAHSKTGIDIHPGATIGESFFIDHGTGIVIGQTTIIGKNVKLYQGVTLGAVSLRDGQALRGSKRHPTIGDNVTIYSNASILGDIKIGDNSTIGGNVFITKEIAPNTKVYLNTRDYNVEK